MKPSHRSARLLVALLAVATALESRTVPATQEEGADTVIDGLEQRLELERHARYLQRRATVEASAISAFTSDGCSGGLSVGWEYLAAHVPQFQRLHGVKPPWEPCCTRHDRAYHRGGNGDSSPAMSFASRRTADLELQSCVLGTGLQRVDVLGKAYSLSAPEVERLYQAIALLMYRAVRIGGMPCTGLPWRWGYGWPECD